MITACIITYNDFPLIKDCIESIYSKVDRIIAVDGKYRDFAGDSKYSTDDTLKYLETKGKVEVYFAADFTEVDKRNLYLEKLNDGDICLNLDSDEFLTGDIKELEADFGIIKLHDGHSKHIQDRATRFFKYRDGMRYRNVHYTLYYNDRQLNKLKTVINSSFTFEKVDSFYLTHNWHLRSQARRQLKSKYYKKLVRMESGFPR